MINSLSSAVAISVVCAVAFWGVVLPMFLGYVWLFTRKRRRP